MEIGTPRSSGPYPLKHVSAPYVMDANDIGLTIMVAAGAGAVTLPPVDPNVTEFPFIIVNGTGAALTITGPMAVHGVPGSSYSLATVLALIGTRYAGDAQYRAELIG